jgi:hypothetical protein
MPFVDDLHQHRDEINRNWWSARFSSEDDMWLPIPISHNNRWDDDLADSNYVVAERTLNKVSPFGTDYRCDGWPGGVIHTLLVRADDAAALKAAEEIVNSLREYPILDEEDLSEREWESNHPSESECYADDCGCDVSRHRKMDARDHAVELSQAATLPEYDEDGDYTCNVCGEWFTFSDAEKFLISYRINLRDMEAKGQSRLF